MTDNVLTTLEKLVRDGQKYMAASYALPLGMTERILAKMQADEERIEMLRNHIDRLREHIAVIGKK